VSVILISFNTHHFVYFLLPWINFFLWTVFVCLDIFKNYLSSIFSFPTSEFTRMYVVPVYVCACFSLLFFLFKETISDLKKILYLSYSFAIQLRKKKLSVSVFSFPHITENKLLFLSHMCRHIL
jgi:hypothetical protein